MEIPCPMTFKLKFEVDKPIRPSQHASNLFRSLNNQRLNGQFCDVVIHVGDRSFMAQRNVLAACSEYFRTMFTSNMLESHERHINISGVTEDAMDIIIQFIYTSHIDLDVDNVEMVLAAASMFLMDEVFKKCVTFLEALLTFANCLDLLAVADLYSCASLKESAIELARRHFKDIAKTPGFLLISFSLLLDFVSSDNLHVDSEKEVYEAVMLWTKHSEPTRRQHLPQLLRHVRLPLLDRDYLVRSVRPVLKGDGRSTRRLEEAVFKTGPTPNVRKQWDVLFAVSEVRCSMKQGWDITPFGDWKPGPMLPERLNDVLSVALLDQVVYVAGTRQCLHVGLFAFSLPDKAWSRCPPPDCIPYDSDYTLAAFGSYLYMYGSTRDPRVRVFMRFDPMTSSWLQLRPLDVGMSPVLLATDGHLYAISGNRDLSDYSNAGFVYRYRSDVDQWEKMPWQVLRRVFHSAAQFQGRVFVAGGLQVTPPRASSMTSVVERYDPADNQWRNVAELPEQRHNASLVVSGRRLYVIGGFARDVRRLVTSVLVYDADADGWGLCQDQAVEPFKDTPHVVKVASLSQPAALDRYKRDDVDDVQGIIEPLVNASESWFEDFELNSSSEDEPDYEDV